MLADLELDLIDQARGLLLELGFAVTVYGEPIPASDPVVTYGPNGDLAGPIALAYRDLGLAPASGSRPSIAEIDALTTPQYGRLYDWAFYRLLQKLRRNFLLVDSKSLDGELKLSQLRDALDADIAWLARRLGDDGRQPLQVFTIGLANTAALVAEAEGYE